MLEADVIKLNKGKRLHCEKVNWWMEFPHP